MNKYIRMKDNKIYKIISEAKEDFAQNYDIVMLVEDNEGNRSYLGKEDLKYSQQAEDAADLCDGFYVDVDDHPFAWTEIYTEVEKAIESARDWQSYSNRKYLQYDIKIYGFVKTTEGFNFVTTVDFGKEELEEDIY